MSLRKSVVARELLCSAAHISPQQPPGPRPRRTYPKSGQSIHGDQRSAVGITGGVSSTPAAEISETSFISTLYSNEPRAYLDGIGMYPYAIPYGIRDDPRHV